MPGLDHLMHFIPVPHTYIREEERANMASAMCVVPVTAPEPQNCLLRVNDIK
jgi:hypothetical protein